MSVPLVADTLPLNLWLYELATGDSGLVDLAEWFSEPVGESWQRQDRGTRVYRYLKNFRLAGSKKLIADYLGDFPVSKMMPKCPRRD